MITIDPEQDSILNKIHSTKHEITYWKRQKALRLLPHAKAKAGALVLLYQSQLRVLEAQLETTPTD